MKSADCFCCWAILAHSFLRLAVVQAQEPMPAYSETERQHWSFQPLSTPEIPRFESAADREYARHPIDAFILHRLRREGLEPAAAADRQTLFRRLTFDLHGLPPTPEALAAFTADSSPDAYTQWLDQLLAQPQYGEQWGRHWLDVVRFAESEGFEYDRHIANAWMYRDYVIHAFNSDKPYDEFVREQIAGDELAAPVDVAAPGKSLLDDPDNARRIAAGFHRLGPVRRNAGNPDVAFSRNEILTERTDIVGVAFLGLTVGCARCHDHMFDPIRQTDYYRLQAYLAATHDRDTPLTDEQTYRDWKAETESLEKQIYELRMQLGNAKLTEEDAIKARMTALQKQLPEPLPTLFSVESDVQRATPIHLLMRGDENMRGGAMGMRPLGVLIPDNYPEHPVESPHGKLALAEWIANPRHPLTARVIVNRVWQYHFGQGLVPTPNDFGANGQMPTHPELLDWLAGEFIRQGWSFKAMHRLILTSRTWQQSSRVDLASRAHQRDPENALWWRFNRRRLSAEEVRDSLLQMSGELNLKMGGPSILVPVDPDLVNLLYDPKQWKVTEDPQEHNRRSIYLIHKRNLKLPFLEVLDEPDLQTSCAVRQQSTHAPQSLELLNGQLSNRLAEAFASRLHSRFGQHHDDVIQAAFLTVAGRAPTLQELDLSREYLGQGSLPGFALAMFNLNAFMYVD